MASSNVELVRDLYTCRDQARLDAVSERLAENVIWRIPPTGFLARLLLRSTVLASGRDDVAVALSADRGEVVADEFLEASDRVVVVFRGTPADPREAPVFAQVVTLHEDEVVELHDYTDRAAALTAVGLATR